MKRHEHIVWYYKLVSGNESISLPHKNYNSNALLVPLQLLELYCLSYNLRIKKTKIIPREIREKKYLLQSTISFFSVSKPLLDVG